MQLLNILRPKSFSTLLRPTQALLGLSNNDNNMQVQRYKSWVFACSTAIAEKTQQLEVSVKRQFGRQLNPILDHPILDLLAEPNPYWDIEEIYGILSCCMNVYGEGFALIHLGGSGQPESIEPLYPDLVQIKKNTLGQFTHYEYRDGRRQLRIGPELMIHPRRPNPLDFYRGIGGVEAGYDIIKSDQYATRFHINSLNNRAIPASVLETDQKHLTRKQQSEIISDWEEKHQGLKEAGKTAILYGGLKFKPVGQSLKDIELIESKKYNEHTIKQIFRVSGAILGLEAGSNRATAEAQESIFIKNVVKPQMELIVKAFKRRLLPFYESSISIGLVDPVPKDSEFMLKAAAASVNVYKTINEVREENGLPPVTGGNVIYQGLNKVPLGFDTEPQVEPDPEANRPAR